MIGRRRRGTGRGIKWASVNRPRPDSTDDDLDSDLSLELELDDNDEDDYEGVPPPGESDLPDEDEPVAEWDMPSSVSISSEQLLYCN